LIEGLNGDQRKPFVKDYWDDSDPHRRLGQNADTFAEFEARVRSFMGNMGALPDGTVVFGHGIWFGLFHWLLLGYRVRDADEMRAFRRFQQALPMPNCATFSLTQAGGQRWSIQADTGLMHRIAAVKIES
jgi:broad specificity phosphatase PhoE